MTDRFTLVLRRIQPDGQSEAVAAITDQGVIQATLDAFYRLGDSAGDEGKQDRSPTKNDDRAIGERLAVRHAVA